MLKIEIRLNDERIKKDSKYNPDAIHNAIERTFAKHGFKHNVAQDGTETYLGNGASVDYGVFGNIITGLKRKEWFMDYVDKWILYNSDDGFLHCHHMIN